MTVFPGPKQKNQILSSAVFGLNKTEGGFTRAPSEGANGFTLIELLVAISIMGILLGLMTVNLSGLRANRNINIAQNELVTNLRKAQSYTLSSRQVAPNISGQVFVMKFDASNPSIYKLQAIYNIFATPTPPVLLDVETFQLPQGVRLVTPSPVTIYNPGIILPASAAYACGLVSFKAPFARLYLTGGCNVTSPPFQSIDDYQNILSHVANFNNNHTSADASAVIQLTDTGGTQIRKVLIRGVTGVICPTLDETNCSN